MRFMNNKYIKTLLAAVLLTVVCGLGSCKKFLDREPQSIVGGAEAFKNFTNFQGFTEELYHCIPDFSNAYWTNSWNWGEDEIQTTANNFHFIIKIDDGNFWGWQSQFDGWQAGWMDRNNTSTNDDRMTKSLWKLGWYGIRKCNMGLENLTKLTDATQEEKDLIKGQLLFFRGWFHFMFMQYFGGLPYIDKVLPGDEKLTLPRLKYNECADKAGADFQEAANLLPVNWDNTTAGKRTLGKNTLRINKIMALGYLGKNYLWAGSPLMNSVSTGSQTYNAEYCKKAAEALGQVLQMCETGEAPYSLVEFSKYYSNFYSTGQSWLMPGATEAIFRGPYYGAHNTTYNTARQYQPNPLSTESVKFLPTANYVDYYGMANGLPIKDITQADAASGYDPSYPWKGRDPRFYNDIVYDGVKCIQGATTTEAARYATLYTGGAFRNISNGSRTGYVLYKFIPRTANEFDQGWSYDKSLNVHLPYMRLADVYLMYAEAAAQGYGSSAGKSTNYGKTAVEAVNVIRKRAGVAVVDAQFLGSLDAFMPEMRRERAVELSFEGHRFNDLRRWMLLIKSPYTLKKSIEFDRAPGFSTIDPQNNRVLNIREATILERKYTEKHYWFPLKTADASMYLEFAQNPGW
jgi:starch-binding outer membrane protein, SusD/RagB family